MADFRIRAVEVHSSYAWDFPHIIKVLDFAESHKMNTLILHRNDAVEQVVYPGLQFGVEKESCLNIYERYGKAYRKIYTYTPTRRSGPLLRRGYLRRVVEEANRRGIEVYLQNKELSFPDVFLELYPELTKDGHVCPNDPFWWNFLRTKYLELFEDIPGIAGIITSVGTGESRISITSNRCTCEYCRNTDPEMWYRKVILTIHETLNSLGKKLVLRDFVFTHKDQDNLASVFDSLPKDIAVSIKDTPHDYYPSFPQNRLISELKGRDKWIEYDTMAQYFGWGIGPSTMLNYMRERMTSALGHGAEGVILRTDWESLDGHTSFDTLNIINLHAGAAYGVSVKTSPVNIYRRWLEDQNAFPVEADSKSKDEATGWISSVFDRNWDVVRGALYMNDCVFNDCSTFPAGYKLATWLAEEKNSLKDWVPEKSDALEPSPENTMAILREKDAALDLVQELRKNLADPPVGLSSVFISSLQEKYGIFEKYIKGFRILGKLYALVRFAESGNAAQELPGGILLTDLIDQTMKEAEYIIQEYETFYHDTSYSSAVYQLLNSERLKAFVDDAMAVYKSIQ